MIHLKEEGDESDAAKEAIEAAAGEDRLVDYAPLTLERYVYKVAGGTSTKILQETLAEASEPITVYFTVTDAIREALDGEAPAAVTPAEEGVLYLDSSVPVYEYESEAAPADAGAAPLWALSIAAFALAAAALLLALPRRSRTKNDGR